MKPVSENLLKESKGGKKETPHFSRQQVAEDTERSFTGRPQKYGAAQEDDSPTEGDSSQPGQAKATSEDAGIEPEQQGLEEGMPGSPFDADSPEHAQSQVDSMPNTPEAHHALHKQHHGNLHDLHKRVAALESKSGGKGHDLPSGSGPQAAGSSPDDDGY